MKSGDKVLVMSELPVEEAKPLILAMSGKPYFLLVREKGKMYASSMTDNFNISALFHWIALYARENKEFRSHLADFVIDLSKEV